MTTTRESTQQLHTSITTLIQSAGLPTDWLNECDVTHNPDTYETNIYWSWEGVEDRYGSWSDHYTVDVEGEGSISIEDEADFIPYILNALGEGQITRIEVGTDHLPMLMAGAIPIPA